jgi:hypothetical protein
MVTASTERATTGGVVPLTRAAVALAEFHGQQLNITEVLAALESSTLLTPVPDGSHLLVGQSRGITWVPAFTSEHQLRRYAILRCEADRPWQYRRIPGEKFLGAVLDGVPDPCGLAIDVAGQHPLLLPRRARAAGGASGWKDVVR